MTRGTKLKLNMLTTIIYQIVSIVSGFILPRFFLRYYGSEVNGLVSSITQFLAVITLCECGVGAVVQTALFKPIAENDEKEISRIYKSSTKFFNKIAIILIVYTAILVFAYPHIVNKSFDTLYTGVLIITLSISLLAQYYFAITYKLILNAAQLIYIQMIVSTVSLVLNVVISIVLMYMGMSIQIVKLASAGIFVLQPLVYKYAVNHRFNIDRNIVLNEEPIKQKWNGLAQHLATVILENTDVLVLTFFSTLSSVSVYSVYHMVTNGIKLLFTSLANSVKSLLGDMYARNEMTQLNKTFSRFEWAFHSVVTLIYSICAVLIVPFITVYTDKITDANYKLPLFGVVMCIAMAIYCIRLPYNQMVMAAGHFKQTQNSAIIEAILNLTISIAVVYRFGLIGVALGTLIAVLYRTVYLAVYLSKYILKRNILIFLKRCLKDCVIAAVIYISTKWINMTEVSYVAWFIMAVKVGIISVAECVLLNLILDKKEFKSMVEKMSGRKSLES